MQAALSWIRTRIAEFITYDDNCYTLSAFFVIVKLDCFFLKRVSINSANFEIEAKNDYLKMLCFEFVLLKWCFLVTFLCVLLACV